MTDDDTRPREDTSYDNVATWSPDAGFEELRPHQSRREYQEALRRKQRRRQARARRLRAIMGLKFWTRTATFLAILLCTIFWAKFALVYDIPSDLTTPDLSNVVAYVTVKPWWFGPPVFDLGATEAARLQPYLSGEDALLQGLGRYQGVLLQPEYVWVLKQ